MSQQRARRGRPRSNDADEKILDAARKLLAQEGYPRMSVDAVARAAGVTRPTIYLRWPTKEELVIAAVSDVERPERIPMTDDPYADLKLILREVKVSFIDHGNAQLLGPIQTERRHAPALFEAFRDRLLTPRRRSIRTILEHGIELGQLRPDIDVDAAINAMVGSLYAKIMTGDDIAEDFTDHVVDVLWSGMQQH